MFSGSAFSGLPIADSGGFLYAAGVADLVGVSDSYAPTGVYFISAVDTATVAEAIYPVGSYAHFINESARSVVIRRIGGGFSYGAMSSGPFSALGDFTTEISGDEIFGFVNVQSRFTDIASGVDVMRSNAVENISFTDSAFAFDSTRSSTVLPALVVGGGVTNEFIISEPIYARAVSELVIAEDVISNVTEYGQIIKESSVITDSQLALVELFATTVDSSQASELCSMTRIISSEVNDTITTIDRLNTTIIAQSQLNEMSHAVDALVARRYWENINTAESAGWKLVQNNIGID